MAADIEDDLPTIDLAETDGYIVDDSDEDDPSLITPSGEPVDTWRENYPYDERMTREEYERTKRALQIELLKFQNWTKETGQRHIILFEGRDAAGKGGTIKRFNEHLNPRGARTVALEKPSPRESTSWYFQRYIQHFPAGGEMVFFDRSWYNRSGVERVMGFCTESQHAEFLREVPMLENMILGSGISLTKFWFSVTKKSSAPGLPSGKLTRCANGNCRRWTWLPWTNGMITPTPRKNNSATQTPKNRPGSL